MTEETGNKSHCIIVSLYLSSGGQNIIAIPNPPPTPVSSPTGMPHNTVSVFSYFQILHALF
jgi:hypothetical protein